MRFQRFKLYSMRCALLNQQAVEKLSAHSLCEFSFERLCINELVCSRYTASNQTQPNPGEITAKCVTLWYLNHISTTVSASNFSDRCHKVYQTNKYDYGHMYVHYFCCEKNKKIKKILDYTRLTPWSKIINVYIYIFAYSEHFN